MNLNDTRLLPAPNLDTMADPVSRVRRVAFLDHTARLGGGEIALLNMVIALDRTRYEPVVVLFSKGPLAAKLLAAGVETHLLPLSQRITDVRKDSLGLGRLLKLRDVAIGLQFCCVLSRWLARNHISLVHCNSLKSDILGGIAARLAGKRCIWHIRDRISDDYLPAPVVRVFRMLCRFLPTTLVSNSAATDASLGGVASTVVLGGVRASIVVHDGTTLSSVERPSRAPSLLRVGLIGRITWWKGQDVFIRAAAQLRERFPNTRFQIVGSALFSEAEYDRSIRDLVDELNVGDIVEFLGFREDIAEVVSQLDLVVHASTTGEPFGQVIIEAMAAGKPVVATNGGGVPEILTAECGLLVPMKDPAAMAEAIASLLADADRRGQMGRCGRERVRQHFLIQHTAAKMADVFDNLLDKSAGQVVTGMR